MLGLEVIGQTVDGILFLPFFILVFIVFWFLVGILLCVWIYRDAESRGMNGTPWLIIVLIANIVGLIVYLIVREEKRVKAQGPPPISEQIKFCKYCGQEVSAGSRFCSNCGKAIS